MKEKKNKTDFHFRAQGVISSANPQHLPSILPSHDNCEWYNYIALLNRGLINTSSLSVWYLEFDKHLHVMSLCQTHSFYMI